MAHADDASPAQARRRVLVLAAGSGVGQAAVQMAFLHGARVFATAGSASDLDRTRALGAYEVIDHCKQDIAQEIHRLTNHRGVDIVIEHVGEATWPASVRSLARGGRLVTCDRSFPLAAAADAQRYLEESRQFGKLVLEV